MARGKHAAALFEVISSSKRVNTTAGALRTPKWWFKSRPTGAPAPLGEPAEMELQSHFVAPDPTPEAMVRHEPVAMAAGANGSRRSGFQFDPHRQEFTMRLRFSTAVVAGFALLVAVGMAYVMGRHGAGGPQTADASPTLPTTEIRKQGVVPGALDVNRRTPRTTVNSGNSGTNGAPPRRNEPVKPRETINTGIASDPVSDPAPQPTVGPRSTKLNYIIVQTFPPDKTQVAQQAVDYLKRSGIFCTIESAPVGYKSGWIAVIDTRGWEHTSTDECQAYVAKISTLGEKFGKSRYDHFQPNLYRWK
jgi:hypothetical protein